MRYRINPSSVNDSSTTLNPKPTLRKLNRRTGLSDSKPLQLRNREAEKCHFTAASPSLCEFYEMVEAIAEGRAACSSLGRAHVNAADAMSYVKMPLTPSKMYLLRKIPRGVGVPLFQNGTISCRGVGGRSPTFGSRWCLRRLCTASRRGRTSRPGNP